MRLIALSVATLVIAAGCGAASSGSTDARSSQPAGVSSGQGSPAASRPSAPERRYPVAAEASFMHSCIATSNGKSEYCKSALTCLERRLPYRAFKVYAINVYAGRAQVPRTHAILIGCVKQAAATTGLLPTTS
jgi:hypothetical protein